MSPATYKTVEEIKALRVRVDALVQEMNNDGESSEGPKDSDGDHLYGLARYQATVSLMEAKMWLGKMLEGLGNPFPPELADKAKKE